MNRNYKSAPLPFQGQKRNFIKQFKEALKNYPNNTIYVDLFGGSGLLSHTAKQQKPNSKVIYNDYDNFQKRIQSINETNQILCELRKILVDVPRGNKITGSIKEQVIFALKLAEDKYGYVDYISISSSLLFSMNYVDNFDEFQKQTFYNRVRKSSFNAEGYLDGVDVVSMEYKDLYNKYKDVPNVVFLVDPPYLSTDCSTYKNYWKLSDYLDVLKVLKNTNYFYFTSNKSNVIELCNWIESISANANPFNQASIVYQYNKTTHNTSYTDIMLHKRYTTTTTFKK